MNSRESLSSFNLSILWFGAAISLAEILTGAMLAPLGVKSGLMAIVLGHLIGGALFYGAGRIGAELGKPAIETTAISFGRFGMPFFAVLNILQLTGWTAVMIINGAAAMSAVTQSWFGFESLSLFSILIAGLIALWILIGFQRMKWLNLIAVSSLFVISIILGVIAYSSQDASMASGPLNGSEMPFGIALELSVVMPLSWLPLASDYTRLSKNAHKGALFSAFGYFFGSVLMYAIGLGAALFAGTSDITSILIVAGLPVAALVIVLFSTITTTFLDVFSAAVSFNVLKQVNVKAVSMVVCALGAALAVTVSVDYYEQFLYLIGSAFGPLFAILLTDYFLLGRNRQCKKRIRVMNFVIWCIGVGIYRVLVLYPLPIGVSLPTMFSVMLIKVSIEKLNLMDRLGGQYE